jgi:hypothetical protein
MIPRYLNRSLALSFVEGDISFTRTRLADLVVSSGELVACDPLTCPDSSPFTLRLAKGRYPVDLSIANFGDDQRVAFSIISIGVNPPVRWDLMTVDGQDLASLGPDQFFGYGVDSGTGCFMDGDACDALLERMNEEPDYFEKLIAEMDKTYRHTWSWMSMPFGPANLVAFSTGCGDGTYATYAGYDAAGMLCTIVTDFGILEDKQA